MKKYFFLSLILLFSNSVQSQTVPEYWAIWKDVTQPDTVRMIALDSICNTLIEVNSFDSIFLFQEKIYALAKEKNLSNWILKSLDYRSLICLKYSLSTNPLPFLNEAIVLAKQEKDEAHLAYFFANRGIFHFLNQDLAKATEDYLDSYALTENKQDSVSSIQTGVTLIRLSNAYFQIGDENKAKQFLHRAIEAADRYGTDFLKGSAMSNLGRIFWSNIQIDSADYYWTQAYQLNKRANALSNLQTASYNLSMIRLNQGKKDEGKKLLREAKILSEKFNNTELLFSISRELGAILMDEGNFTEGVPMILTALEKAEKGNFLSQAEGISYVLHQYYESIKDYENSLTFYKKSILYSDSLKNEANQRELYRQESKYEYEKQALSDSLQFAQKQQITQATVQNQRLGLIAGAFALLFLLALAYSIYKSRQRAEAETDRVTELDAFKSKFYTNITHEFRTPLTVILGMINQIEEDPKKNLKEGVELIKRNGKNLLNQINQILDLSKLETKSFNLNPVTDDLIGFVRYAAMSFQSNANSQNLSLCFFTPLEKLTAKFDPDAMQKIVQNLVSNALKFTPSSGEIKVYLTQSSNSIEIKVKDTGVGIAEEELPHIFDRFYQVENPSEKTIEGTGIGLAYVQELVRVMNGNISVESTVGEGTEFVVTLPLMMNDELGMMNGVTSAPPNSLKGEFRPEANKNDTSSINQNITDIANSTASITGGSSPLGTEGARSSDSSFIINNSSLPHLLIIEDNPDVVAYLKNCLADQYQIDIAYNGRIGIEKAFANIPDLIITDVMMPEVGGYEVCDTLKNDERTSHIPIIMLTAKADLASKIAGLKRGADVYLSKPFDKEELLIRMEMMVERQLKLATYFASNLHNGTTEKFAETIEAEVIEMEDIFIQKVKTILEKNYSDEGFGLPQLCSKIGMSRSQLFRKMKALIGESPSGFIRDYRLNKAKELLEKGKMNVSEVAWETGFTNLAHFSKVFQEKFGVQPSATNK